jgi:hypothetical protein
MLDSEQVIRLSPGQVLSMATLGVQRIGGDDRAGDADALHQDGKHRDFVRLGSHLYLAQDGTMSLVEGSQQVIARFTAAGRAA